LATALLGEDPAVWAVAEPVAETSPAAAPPMTPRREIELPLLWSMRQPSVIDRARLTGGSTWGSEISLTLS
jgi:hypothetical protein